MPRADAYAAFRSSADLAVWEASLDHYRDLQQLRDAPGPRQLQELGEAICIAVYSLWLTGLRGDREARTRLLKQHARLVASARHCKRDPHLPESRYALAAAAASCGYDAVARRLCAAEQAPLELAVLMMPSAPEKRSALLKPKLAGMPPPGFLPADYFYAHALLDLGFLDECRRQVANTRKRIGDHPLMLDLAGKLAELEGDWGGAKNCYAASDWKAHQYRRFVCEVIFSAERGRSASTAWELDETLAEGMSLWSAEIGQAEIARSTHLVNACRWHDFDSWLVNFELGVLSFRRRRYSEAEGFLQAATRSAPPESSFPVNRIRFINLTWLTGSRLLRDVPVTPELLECGLAVLDSAGPEEDKAEIRRFIARTTGDRSVLDPVFATENNYEIAESYDCIGEIPKALEFCGRALQEAYLPRALTGLAGFFIRARFRNTAAYLVGLIIEQSWDDFVVLWELACALGTLQRKDGTLEELLAAHFETLTERLPALCMNEFQHIIRAMEFYLENSRQDLAARLLMRADQLAESAEEQLQLARARAAIACGEIDLLGIENLLRARMEATDRLVRLQIAREFARYGQAQQARAILEEEGVLGGKPTLHPIEYVIALQCGEPCLAAAEIRQIGAAAGSALGESIAAGSINRYGKYYTDRLAGLVAEVAAISAARDDTAERAAAESPWIALKAVLEQTREDPNLEAEKTLLTDRVNHLGDLSLHEKYALWENVFGHFESQLEGVKRIRPAVDDADTPLGRSRSLLSGARAREVSALWKDYFQPARDGAARQARAALRRFSVREAELKARWEQARAEAMAQPLERLAFRSRMLRTLLQSIREQERRGETWPSWLAVGEHIERDIQSLDEELSRPVPQCQYGEHRDAG